MLTFKVLIRTRMEKALTFQRAVCGVLLLMLFSSDAVAQFVERSEEVGVSHEYHSVYFGGGVGMLDINNDNLLDLFFTGGTGTDKVYLNNGTGFDRVISYLLPEDFEYYDYESQGVATGDLNNDGYDDIFISTQKGYQNVLLINNQDDTFDAIPAEESGIDNADWSISSVMGDINGDGLLDIFVTNYVKEDSSYVDSLTGLIVFDHIAYRNILYINQGDHVFSDDSEAYGITKKGTTLAAAFTDYDNDMDMDLYVINDFGQYLEPNELYRKLNGTNVLEDVSISSGANIGLFGMGVAVGDYDNDLDLDYYITNIGRNSLLRNNGNGTFNDVANEAAVQDSSITEVGAKVGWGTGFFDFNQDGLLDLFISNGYIPADSSIVNPLRNPNALYQNLGNGVFTEVSSEMRVDLTTVCRGAATGDLDNDGDLDMIFVPVNYFGGFGDTTLRTDVAIYYNENASNGNWISFKTIGTISNRNGYGAHIYIYDHDGKVQMREVDGGSSHASSNSPFVHFGIGSATAVDSAIIFWPSGWRQSVYLPIINQLNEVTESPGNATSVSHDGVWQTFDVFPNPAASEIKVDLTSLKAGSGALSWELYANNGKLLDRSGIKSNIFEIDIEDQIAGSYQLFIRSDGRLVGRRQIIRK